MKTQACQNRNVPAERKSAAIKNSRFRKRNETSFVLRPSVMGVESGNPARCRVEQWAASFFGSQY